MKILKNKRGFSLVELMVVVAIMGILSAIAIPAYINYQEEARVGVFESILQITSRTAAIEIARGATFAVGASTEANSFAKDIWEKVQSTSKGTASLHVAGTETTWCMQVSTGGKDEYSSYHGCIDSTGSVHVVDAEETPPNSYPIDKADVSCKTTALCGV